MDREDVRQDESHCCQKSRGRNNWHGPRFIDPGPKSSGIKDFSVTKTFYLWQKLGVEISKHKPTSKRELIEKIIEAWHHLVTPEQTLKLVDSMPWRCRTVIRN